MIPMFTVPSLLTSGWPAGMQPAVPGQAPAAPDAAVVAPPAAVVADAAVVAVVAAEPLSSSSPQAAATSATSATGTNQRAICLVLIRSSPFGGVHRALRVCTPRRGQVPA